jgi:hypothetical protein
MKVLQYISELLLHHDCVIVPGFGGFIATHVPAGIQPVVNSFAPPRKEILFNAALTHNDGLLATYIAQKEHISYPEALVLINKFVEESLQELKNKGKIEMLHVGTVMLDSNNFYKFQQDQDHNLLLSSYGLTNFISPSIQRESIEKRIEKAFSESRTQRSDRKTSNVWAKVAMISVPAAAVFVWAFVNVGTINDVSNNYTNLTSIFSGNSNTVEKVVRCAKNINYNIPKVYENALDVENCKSIFKPEQQTFYPCFTESSVKTVTETDAATADVTTPNGPCKFFIIGSCNRVKDLAENYKSRLINKGYQNANIIEPKDNGLFKVYINCFDTEEAAKAGLTDIQNNENPDAWLLKM